MRVKSFGELLQQNPSTWTANKFSQCIPSVVFFAFSREQSLLASAERSYFKKNHLPLGQDKDGSCAKMMFRAQIVDCYLHTIGPILAVSQGRKKDMEYMKDDVFAIVKNKPSGFWETVRFVLWGWIENRSLRRDTDAICERFFPSLETEKARASAFVSRV